MEQKRQQHRRTVDPTGPFNLAHLQYTLQSTPRHIQPETTYTRYIPPYASHPQRSMDTPTKFTHLSSNKAKHAIHTITFTPSGSRVLVASHSGEFSLWNGTHFNFESIMQAHDDAVMSMSYSHNDDWLVSGDQSGTIKIWGSSLNNVNILHDAHAGAVQDLSWSPNDSKFLSASDDNSLKIWNFAQGKEERVLQGHHWDVKSCDWHPTQSLVVSGSKDNVIKLWDPRSGNNVGTIHGFKHTVTKVKFQPKGGRLLAAMGRDKTLRIYDLRNVHKELFMDKQEVDFSAFAWHPQHESMFSAGTYAGAIAHYDNLQMVHQIPYAHEKSVTCLTYHPVGHVLASSSGDRSVRFWARARPNDPNACDDPTYNDKKVNAWYFVVNNHVNSVLEKFEDGVPPVNQSLVQQAQQQGQFGYQQFQQEKEYIPEKEDRWSYKGGDLPGLSYN